MKVLAVNCGLPGSADIAKRLQSADSIVVFHNDGRKALDSVEDSKPDFIVLMIKGAIGKWLYRVRQLSGKVPLVVLCDPGTSSSDILRMVASGVSCVLRADVEPSLVYDAYRLAAAGYLVAPSPMSERSVSGPLKRMPLTSREIEILQLVSQGKSNAEIAKELFIAEVTVRNHLSNIFKKTGFRNRTGASMAFTLAGLLSGEEK